ncbi:glycosyltransferase family 4 protein [Tenacibaculum aestuariivivum]|uniref:glycosyltransferase family 4 protein n=1 Tax=Tenacibaculum aestuariivivum TaxID=2006131 RepID=UPI003AB63AB5
MKNNSIKIIRTTTVPQSFNLLKGQLKFLNGYYNVIAVSGKGESLENTKNREGVKAISVDMERRISPIKDFISLVKLCFLFKREKPTIIHSITPKAGLLSMLAGKIVGVPIRMHTFTGLIFPTKVGLMQKLLVKTDKILCWASTNVYPEGLGVKEDLINYNITDKPLKVIANGNVNGIDIDFFNPDHISLCSTKKIKDSLNINLKDFVFIFVGRLVSDKGINELVSSFKELIDTGNTNIKLLLVGEEERDLDPLEEQTIIEIENNPNIIAVGYQKDVRPYFAISNVLAFPSYREGFPNVVIQAGAMGVPSIVSNINGCNEIIVEGENGIIVPVKNTKKFKLAMKELVDNSILYKELKNNCRNMIINRYEQKFVWNELLEEYKRLL